MRSVETAATSRMGIILSSPLMAKTQRSRFNQQHIDRKPAFPLPFIMYIGLYHNTNGCKVLQQLCDKAADRQ